MTDGRVVRFRDAGTFLDRCARHLAADEALHCVILGFALAARDRPDAGAGRTGPRGMALRAVLGGTAVRAVAGVTDIAALLSAEGAPDQIEAAMAAMAEAVAADHPGLRGFEGLPPVASAFGRHWQAATGRPPRLALRERIHRLDRLVPPAQPAPGRWRLMAGADVALVGGWIEAFAAEALPHEDQRSGVPIATAWLADRWREVCLWELGGRPVSMAVAAWPTMTGIRISSVYTPPAERGRGFATAVTAAVTASQLAAGRRSCFLYTDVANPTSNRIYRSLGYRPVADVDRYVIDAVP